MDLDTIREEAKEYSSLFRRADYFIQVVKGKRGYNVVGIEDYKNDYKFFYDDDVVDVKKAREFFSVGAIRPTSYWVVDKVLFKNFLRKESLNKKLKKIKS